MTQCPKCKRQRRVIQKTKKLAQKVYWISVCIECNTIMAVDDME